MSRPGSTAAQQEISRMVLGPHIEQLARPASAALEASDALDRVAAREAIDPRVRGHMPNLDGVRGLAVSSILVLHFVANMERTNPAEAVVMRVLEFGELGVDLFFVLSGFLITGILLSSKESSHYFQNFYARRTLRIFPLYYGVLFALLVVAPAIPALRGPELAELQAHQVWAWLYAVNVFAAKQGQLALPYIDHFWSLAVEEHFYLFWPYVVWITSPRTLTRVCIAVVFGTLALRYWAEAAALAPVVSYVLTPFRLDSLCMGALLCLWVRRPGGLTVLEHNLGRFTLILLGLLTTTYVGIKLNREVFVWIRPIRATLFSAGFAMLLVRAVTAPAGSLTTRVFSGPLRTLGTYSYGVYVFHHFFSYYFLTHRTERVVAEWVGSHTLAVALQALVGSALSFAVAVASYHFYEKPFLALKRYWPASGN